MKHLEPSNDRWQAKVLWWLVLGTAVLALYLRGGEVLYFSLSQVFTVIFALMASVLLCRHECPIPGTSKTFSAKTVFAFWATMWMGVTGGMLVAVSASIVANLNIRSSKRLFIANIASDTASMVLAGLVYYRVLSSISGPSGSAATAGPDVLAAAVLMGFTHYLLSSALHLYFLSSGLRSGSDLSTANAVILPAASDAISLVAAVGLVFVFDTYGIQLGIVIIALSIVGNLGYSLHLRSLGIQTKLISEASKLHLSTVEALATAIDARDQIGTGHVRRTQIYAVGLGRILGLPEDEISALEMGALLHDVGKLAVPDHILNKPGRLTRSEMEKAKIHSNVGASILESIGFPYPVVPTVKHHHEAWDGTGYPNGLRGTDIPLGARILRVADAYDSLRADRPFRAAIARDEACEFLRSHSGKQFDPYIVSTFLRNIHNFEQEIDQLGIGYLTGENVSVSNTPASSDAREETYVQQIIRANREVYTLYELAREFSSRVNVDETLSLLSRKIREFVPYDTCLIYLLDESGDTATVAFAEGRHANVLRHTKTKVGEGATGYVLKKAKPVENVDPALDFALTNVEIAPDFVAMASLPLMVDEKLIGAVSIYSAELAMYEEEHLRLLETISRIAADAVHKSVGHAAYRNSRTYRYDDRAAKRPQPAEPVRSRTWPGTPQRQIVSANGFRSRWFQAGQRHLRPQDRRPDAQIGRQCYSQPAA